MSKTLRWLFALNIVIVLLWGLTRVYHAHQAANVLSAQSRELAVKLGRSGVVTQSEAERDMTILNHFSQSRDISDEDLDWGINLIRVSPSRAYGGAYARCSVLSEWRAVKQRTPAQQEKIFQTASSLLSDKDNSVSCIAMQVIALMKEPRSIPALLPMLDSPRAELRKQAKVLLAQLGYTPPQTPAKS